jgi:hypothetical protein
LSNPHSSAHFTVFPWLLLDTWLVCWLNVYSHLMTRDRAAKICTRMGIRKRMAWILVLIVVCFLLGNYPESEFYMPTFRNTLFHLHRHVGK